MCFRAVGGNLGMPRCEARSQQWKMKFTKELSWTPQKSHSKEIGFSTLHKHHANVCANAKAKAKPVPTPKQKPMPMPKHQCQCQWPFQDPRNGILWNCKMPKSISSKLQAPECKTYSFTRSVAWCRTPKPSQILHVRSARGDVFPIRVHVFSLWRGYCNKRGPHLTSRSVSDVFSTFPLLDFVRDRCFTNKYLQLLKYYFKRTLFDRVCQNDLVQNNLIHSAYIVH